MRTVDRSAADAPGEDSFLDIVANMVGIMILLVMVVGLRASREAARPTQPPAESSADTDSAPLSREQVHAAFRTATDLRHDARELIERAVNVHAETNLREQERNWLVGFVAAAEEELNSRQRELSLDQQRDFELRSQLSKAQQALDELARARVSLLSEPLEVDEIQNLPTPLAQTVSGKEVHLRLADGHVAFVPLDALLAELKQHAERNLWRFRDQDSVVSTVGPVGGFRLRYRLQKSPFTVRAGERTATRGTYIELTRWELLPASPQVGEAVEQALLPRSDLSYALKKYSPESTTITIWTYPGSFNEFRRLKQALFQTGYATAGRPLPEGVRIGGSPQGSKSAAQ